MVINGRINRLGEEMCRLQQPAYRAIASHMQATPHSEYELCVVLESLTRTRLEILALLCFFYATPMAHLFATSHLNGDQGMREGLQPIRTRTQSQPWDYI